MRSHVQRVRSRWSAMLGFLGMALVVLGASVGVMAQEAGEGIPVTLAMGDYAFNPDRVTLESGKTYALKLVNNGPSEHEIAIGRGLVSTDEGRAFTVSFFKGIELLADAGGVKVEADELVEVELEPDESVTLVFTVPEQARGSWDIACFVEGHYELGMHGTLTVR